MLPQWYHLQRKICSGLKDNRRIKINIDESTQGILEGYQFIDAGHCAVATLARPAKSAVL
jgi:hypothetical protein